jgi:hypothetical protein
VRKASPHIDAEALGIEFMRGVHVPDLESFHDFLLDTAAQFVTAGGGLAVPMTVVLSKSGAVAIVPPLPSKDGIAIFQKAVSQHATVRACAVVFEAWMSKKTPEEHKANPVQPVDDPDRGECITVSIMTAGRQAISISPIERPANIVKKAPFKWLDEVKGEHAGRFVRRRPRND